MKLIIKKAGLELLKPSRTYERQARGEQGQGWQKTKRFWPHKKPMPCSIEVQAGSHEAERIDNPFIPSGEPWLVLKGSRIGAAESYLRGLSGLVTVVDGSQPQGAEKTIEKS